MNAPLLTNKKRMLLNYFKRIVIILFLPLTLCSQTSELDSLLNLTKVMKDDTSKVQAFHTIARIYRRQLNDITKSSEYSIKELLLARKLNYKQGIADAYINIAVVYNAKVQLDLAMYYNKKALVMMRELRNKKGESNCLINMALICNTKGDYNLAVEYSQDAIRIKDSIRDEKGLAIAYNNMAIVQETLGDYEQALSYNLKSLRINEKLHDNVSIAMSFINMGSVFEAQKKFDQALGYFIKAIPLLEGKDNYNLGNAYNNIGNIYSTRSQLKTALAYHTKALEVRQQVNDKRGIAMSYNNIGNIHLKQKQLESALYFHRNAYNLSKQMGDKKNTAIAGNSLGSTYEAKNNFPEARRYFEESLLLSQQINFKEGMRDGYEALSAMYKHMKQYDKALDYMELFKACNDSILNKESLQQLNEMNTRYETEKKEREILLLTKDMEFNTKIMKQQRLVRWGLMLGVILLSFSVISIYRRYRFKQKANVILETQKQEIEQTLYELTNAQDELNKTMEQKEKLTSILAHDLRTPLRFMTTISEYLYKNASSITLEELKELSAELSTSSKSTFAFADELLTWLSIQKNNYKTEYSKVDLLKLLNELHLFFADIARTKNTWIIVASHTPIVIETDERLLKIILRNIIDNAIKNTDDGQISLSALQAENGEVHLEVRDTGKGMTTEELQKLIEINTFGFAFEIKDKLGFQIVSDLANLIHCKIQLESEIGKGTSVMLQFSGKEGQA